MWNVGQPHAPGKVTAGATPRAAAKRKGKKCNTISMDQGPRRVREARQPAHPQALMMSSKSPTRSAWHDVNSCVSIRRIPKESTGIPKAAATVAMTPCSLAVGGKSKREVVLPYVTVNSILFLVLQSWTARSSDRYGDRHRQSQKGKKGLPLLGSAARVFDF